MNFKEAEPPFYVGSYFVPLATTGGGMQQAAGRLSTLKALLSDEGDMLSDGLDVVFVVLVVILFVSGIICYEICPSHCDSWQWQCYYYQKSSFNR